MRLNFNNVLFVGCWWMYGKIKKYVYCNLYVFSKWDKKKMEENEIVFGSVNIVWKEWSIIWFKKKKLIVL